MFELQLLSLTQVRLRVVTPSPFQALKSTLPLASPLQASCWQGGVGLVRLE